MALITETQLRARLAGGIPNPLPVAEDDKLTPAAADFLRSRGIEVKRTPSRAANARPFDSDEDLGIPVGVSARHVHLSPEHAEALFGPGYALTPHRELSQRGQFAAMETVTLVGPKGYLPGVRILGPSRGASQVEISRTDGYALGIQPPVRLSGRLQGTPGVTIVGARGTVVLNEGLIVAKNHVHMSPEDASRFRVASGDSIIVRTSGDRPVWFADVVVRVSPAYSLDLHLDTDEANAASLRTGDTVRMIGKNGEIRGA
ncbi:phosphate propanoyltransferase [Cohnella sp. CFH 77786]|uniref:phosphate propanoyltransferase n=1 Tax=Cohnella sp. CFH 77786 TaxID=2662265 RepID=UPI001C60DE87|nr:phosphate propanoyltransferase [Cohnella sp. CFH 77786]MBW5444470.1 phosphate propanoyltransferase [Cohnella sp. CFH 77786]